MDLGSYYGEWGRAGQRVGSGDCRVAPRIGQGQAEAIEVAGVARGDAEASGQGDRRDLQVEGCDRATGLARRGGEGRVLGRGGAIEGQSAGGEDGAEQVLGGGGEGVAAAAWGEEGEAVQDLGLRDGGDEQVSGGLGIDPGDDLGGGRGAHQFREHVGVEDEHGARSVERGRFAAWQAGGEVEVHATCLGEQGMDGGAETGSGRVVGDGGTEDGADFLLHRAAVFGSAEAEAVSGGVVEVTDGEGGHEVTALLSMPAKWGDGVG